MVNIAFVVYRKWGYDIFKKILAFQKKRDDFTLTTLIVPHGYDFVIDKEIKNFVSIYTVDPTDCKNIQSILEKNTIAIACFYSWSWIIKKPITERFTCLCLHPSPLPKYRGGTPIQHQLVNGEKESAVTIFKMTDGIDSGDIYMQTPISFLGTVNDIFARMIDVGTVITKHLIEDAVNNELKFTPQKNIDAYPPLKRRTPSQSQLSTKDLNNTSYEDFYNLVRGLLDPYPNISIQCKNARLMIQEISKHKTFSGKGYLINETTTRNELLKNKNMLYIKLKDYYIKLTRTKLKGKNE